MNQLTQTDTDPQKRLPGKAQTLFTLFRKTLYISTFTFGGGFVIVTFMKRIFADELHWIDEDEMLNLAALAQSSPGAIAVNAAILIGWRVGGFAGMLTAVLGTIIPPIAILSVVSIFYAAFVTNPYVSLLLKGMQAGVAAVILDVVWGMAGNVIKTRQPIYLLIMTGAFVATVFGSVNVISIILAAIGIGIILEIYRHKKETAV